MGYLGQMATNSPKLTLQARILSYRFSPKLKGRSTATTTLKAKAFEKCCESQKERKLVHGEATVRCALLTEDQPNEKETGFRTVTQTCMQHNSAKLCREVDGTECTGYAQNNIRMEKEKYTQYTQCFLSCMIDAS